jgi:neuroligin
LEEIQKDIPDFPKANISEDCLYMNIFVPNRTEPNLQEDRTIYPVIVYIHSGDFSTGTAQAQPGHVLSLRDVVVVTFNYRLGALGFLTTEDEHGPGNWGMSDQLQALDFVKRNILAFRGDPNRITLMGDGAGSVSVGLHLLSPASRGKGYYHQVIMMSGTDLSMFGFIKPFFRPRDYAKQLAKNLGCPTSDSYSMMTCLRDNSTVPWEKILTAQQNIKPNDGALGIVWAPTQDGIFYSLRTEVFMSETPDDLRRQGLFERVPAIIGINSMDGAALANRSVLGLEGGISTETFQKFVTKLLVDWKIIDIYRPRALESIQFQYTHWPDPDNRTARGQEYINMMTDLNYGIGMDRVVKQQSDYSPTYMYIFHWKSWNDWLPWYLGVSHSAAIPYVFGYPFLNETVLNETEMVPRQWFDYDDRNISDFMMYMWSCFAKYGDPTPNITRNVTWEPYNQFNFTYLIINWHSQIWFRFRQSQYGFWNEYFPRMAKQEYFSPTATPTPGAYEYVVATGCVSALLILLLGTMGMLIYLLWYQHRKEEEAPYRHDISHDDSPFSFTSGRTAPSVSTSSSNISKMTAAQYAQQHNTSAGSSVYKSNPIQHSVI